MRVVVLASGDPRLGSWCDEHALSHVTEVDLYDLRDEGPHPFGTYRECPTPEARRG